MRSHHSAPEPRPPLPDHLLTTVKSNGIALLRRSTRCGQCVNILRGFCGGGSCTIERSLDTNNLDESRRFSVQRVAFTNKRYRSMMRARPRWTPDAGPGRTDFDGCAGCYWFGIISIQQHTFEWVYFPHDKYEPGKCAGL